MARSTERRARNCWKHAVAFRKYAPAFDAQRVKRGSRPLFAFPLASSSIRWGPSGAVATAERISCWHPATEMHWRSRVNPESAQSHFPRSAAEHSATPLSAPPTWGFERSAPRWTVGSNSGALFWWLSRRRYMKCSPERSEPPVTTEKGVTSLSGAQPHSNATMKVSKRPRPGRCFLRSSFPSCETSSNHVLSLNRGHQLQFPPHFVANTLPSAAAFCHQPEFALSRANFPVPATKK